MLQGNGIVIKNDNDSYSSILHADHELALLMARGAVVCYDLSSVKRLDVVKVALRFCRTAKEVNGKLYLWIDVNHPQLCELLSHKEIKHYISLIVNDDFMQAMVNELGYGNIEAGKMWTTINSVANICFKRHSLTPYCINEIKVIDLMQLVKAGDNGEYLDYKGFKTQCNTTIEDYKEQKKVLLASMREHIDSIDDVFEQNLFKKVLETTEHSAKLHLLLENFDTLLQILNAEDDIEIKQSLHQVVNDTCTSHYCLSKQCLSRSNRIDDRRNSCIRVWQCDCDYYCINNDDTNIGHQHYMADEEHILKRPQVLEADVVRFQNKKEKWIAFVGLIDGRPYEVFTGIQDDEEGIFCPKSVNSGKIIKCSDENGQKRYDFQFINKRGFKTTIEGLSEKFNPEFWNYAKLISGVLRYGMPLEQVVKLVSSLELDNLTINNWKSGVIKALKKYLPNTDEEL